MDGEYLSSMNSAILEEFTDMLENNVQKGIKAVLRSVLQLGSHFRELIHNAAGSRFVSP